jgi:nitrogen fixation protein FixH
MSAATRWTAAVVGLLGMSVVAVVILIVAASREGGRQVMPAYDTRALAHGDVMAQQARDRALGWQARSAFVGDELTIELRDRDGAPVRSAVIAVDAYHRAEAARVHHVAPQEVAAGQYQVAAGSWRPGIHQITGTARLGDVLFTFDGWAER